MKRWVALTSTKASYLNVSSVLVADTKEMSFRIALSIQTEEQSIETKGLIDCGAEGNFLDKDFVSEHRIPTFPLKESIKAKNIDGSINQKGEIMNATWLSVMIAGVTERIRFYVCRLGKDHLILGLPWLKQTNPQINWK